MTILDRGVVGCEPVSTGLRIHKLAQPMDRTVRAAGIGAVAILGRKATYRMVIDRVTRDMIVSLQQLGFYATPFSATAAVLSRTQSPAARYRLGLTKELELPPRFWGLIT